MADQRILCAHPTHASRVGQPGWNDVLGTRPGRQGADVTIPDLYCGACGDVVNANKITFESAQQTARAAAIAKFAALFPSLSRAELMRIFEAGNRGEV